jgi:hypothetical protein
LGDEKREQMLRQLAGVMRTFFERALDETRREFEKNGLEVSYTRSGSGEELFLERAGILLSVTLNREKPAIMVKVGPRTITELVYDLERGEIVTGTRRRSPNLQAIFSRAMALLIDEALGKPSV